MTQTQIVKRIEEIFNPEYHADIIKYYNTNPGKELFELFESSPAIGMLLVFCNQFNETAEVETSHLWALCPRREILGRLGFPATKSAVKIMKKIVVKDICPLDFDILQDLFSFPESVKHLQHLPSICSNAINCLLLDIGTNYLSFSVFNEIGNRQDADHIMTLLSHLEYMSWETNVTIDNLKSCDAIINLYDELVDLAPSLPEIIKFQNNDKYIFPKPPIETPASTQRDNIHIEYICTPKGLSKEGSIQKNCTFSYINEVKSGSAAIYRVFKPERATLMLRNINDVWTITQFLAKGNRPVQRETRFAIGAYLSRQQEKQDKALG
jgi:hypothetical protein